MGEMIDRVATAISKIVLVYTTHSRADEGYHIVDRSQSGDHSFGGKTVWRDNTPFVRYNEMGLDRPPYAVAEALKEWRGRAAILAMREPSDAMKDIIHEAGLDIYFNYEADGRPGSASDVWRTMIDAALTA